MLYLACIVTTIIETALFSVLGYGKKQNFLLLCIAVNIATNLSINLILEEYETICLVFFMEIVVVLVEYVVYALAIGNSRKLLLYTVCSNIASFIVGIVMFGI